MRIAVNEFGVLVRLVHPHNLRYFLKLINTEALDEEVGKSSACEMRNPIRILRSLFKCTCAQYCDRNQVDIFVLFLPRNCGSNLRYPGEQERLVGLVEG